MEAHTTSDLIDADTIVDTVRITRYPVETVDASLQCLINILCSSELYDRILLGTMIFAGDQLVKLLSKIENRRQRRQEYIKCRASLTFVSLHVSGKLYTRIRELEYQHCDVEPAQAPRGWTCAICMTSKDSHLCEKTLCGHYFHIGCAQNLTSPACPLCRSFM
jgi:hypothetical protein